MSEEKLQRILERIADDLEKMIELVQNDEQREHSRYNIGVMAGIGYAREELEKIIKKGTEN